MSLGRLWVSDTHFHNFTRFATTLDDGVNSRLQHTIDAMVEAVEFAEKQGIKKIIHGGDCFHVRGQISPTVLNPVMDLFSWIINIKGMEVYMIAGNHDLESKESDELSNTASALDAVGVQVINEPTVVEELKLVLIPWSSSLSALNEKLAEYAKKLGTDVDKYTAVIHAPLNGVISGIPDHGLEPTDLAKHGFKRIMCGHYHNHMDFGSVVSIGALTHQTFGDIHSKAGFIIEDEKGNLSHFATSAPRFVDLTEEDPSDQAEFEDCVNGNFVRAKLEDAEQKDIANIKNDLNAAGALGSLITNITTKHAGTTRTGATTSGASIETSVSAWVKGRGFADYQADIEKEAIAILSEV